MFYDAHFIVDVENEGGGVQVDGTVQITGSEGLFVSHSISPLHLPAFPDENHSVDGVLAHMVDIAWVYDRVLMLAVMHGLYVDQGESGLVFSFGGVKVGSATIAQDCSGYFLQTAPISNVEASRRIIWDHFVNDVNGDSGIVRAPTPCVSLPPRGTMKGLFSSSRFHVYLRPLGEEVFVSGEAALTNDTLPFASWGVNVGLVWMDDVAGWTQKVFERLVLGATVVDRLVSEADSCGIHFISVANDLIGAYVGDTVVGQIAVGVRGGIVELSPSRLATPTWTDREGRAWNDFCSKVRRIPDSRIVWPLP